LDVIEEQRDRKHSAFEVEVYKDHLEDIVEVFHHSHAKINIIIPYSTERKTLILPSVNTHVPIHDFDNIPHKHFLIDLLIR